MVGKRRVGTQVKASDIVYVADAAARAALSPSKDGLVVLQIDTNKLYSWDEGSSTWIAASGSSDAILKTIVDAKGDIIAATADDTVTRFAVGADGQLLCADSSEATGLKWCNVSGSGDVVGPASSTDNAIPRYDGTTGKLLQNSGITIDDSNNVNGANDFVGAVMDSDIGSTVLAQQTIGIADNNLLEVDGTPNSTEYARFTANGLEGRTESEFKSDFNLEIGTDVLAQQTIGISDDNLVEIDSASVASGEYAKFTANGLESKSFSEVRADLAVINPTMMVQFVGDSDDVTTSSEFTFIIPASLNGMDLIGVKTNVKTAGTTGSTTFQITRTRGSVDVLSTVASIETGETSSLDATTQPVINTSNDDVVTDDIYTLKIPAVSTTAPKAFYATLIFG